MLSPRVIAGQEGAFAFQIRGGRFLPTGDLRAAEEGWEGEAGGDVGFGMGFTFPFPGPLGMYLGFGQYKFSCDPSVCPQGEKWESTGFDVAFRYVLMPERKVRPWLQVGLHTHRLQSDLYDEDEHARDVHSQGGSGYEVGGGLLVRIAERMSLSPGGRYGQGDAPYSQRPSLRLRYLIVDMGLVVGF